ncbi:MAG: hypothetical protein Kapaf2KO_19280 [Candidatus Kapaibacteriales bacterium]
MKKLIVMLGLILGLASCEKDILDPDGDLIRDLDDSTAQEYISFAKGYYECEDLFSYYPLNGTALDIVNKVDGIGTNAEFGEDRFGNENSAFRSGRDRFIDVFDNEKFDFPESFTISCWIKQAENPDHLDWMGHVDVMGKWGFGDDVDCYMIGINKQNQLQAWFDTGSYEAHLINRDLLIDTDWHNIALSYDAVNSEAKLYLDGDLVDTKETNSSQYTGNPFRIGGRPDGYAAFDGLVDDVLIFDELIPEKYIKIISDFK